MSSLLKKLSVTAALGLVVVACSSSSNTTADGGTGSGTGTTDAGHDGTATSGNNGNATSGNNGGTDSGTDSSATGGDGGTCAVGANGTNDATCDACLNANCCDKWNTCFGDTDCTALQDCVNVCLGPDGGPDSGGCEQDCAAAHPNSVTKLETAITCALDSCDNADAGNTACQAVFGP